MIFIGLEMVCLDGVVNYKLMLVWLMLGMFVVMDIVMEFFVGMCMCDGVLSVVVLDL